MRADRTLPGVLLLTLAVPVPASELEKLLAAPVSPGSVGLLVQYSAEPGVAQRLAAALRNSRPETRAAAARVAHTGYVKAVLPDIAHALATEESPEAAREEIRAIAALGGPATDSKLAEAANRFGGSLEGALLETLARVRGPSALIEILSSPPDSLGEVYRADLLLIASRGAKENFDLVAPRALADGANWAAFLRASAKAEIDLDRAVLDTALESNLDGVAATTAWYLVERGAAKRHVDVDLARLRPRAGAGSDSAFPLELLRRLAGDAAAEDEAWIASLAGSNPSGVDRIEPGSPVVALFTTKEREAVRARYNRRHGISPERADKMAPFWDPTRNRDAGIAHAPDDALVARTVTDLPPGLAADLLVVSGCRAGRKAIGAAEVRYNVEGRPLRVSVVQDFGSSKNCERASTSLILLGLAPPTSFPIQNRPELLVTSFGRDCIGVLDEASAANRPAAAKELEVQRVEGDIEPPILEEKVEPEYPETARQDQKEGVLILEAVISRDGCVGQLRTIKGCRPRCGLTLALQTGAPPRKAGPGLSYRDDRVHFEALRKLPARARAGWRRARFRPIIKDA